VAADGQTVVAAIAVELRKAHKGRQILQSAAKASSSRRHSEQEMFLEQQIFGRIAAQGHFRKDHQMGIVRAGLDEIAAKLVRLPDRSPTVGLHWASHAKRVMGTPEP
jgi:hypothetical protein